MSDQKRRGADKFKNPKKNLRRNVIDSFLGKSPAVESHDDLIFLLLIKERMTSWTPKNPN
jgi:hypothetical protein